MEGVVKELPVFNKVPPVGTLYQVNTPALAVAERGTVPVPQREAGLVDVMEGIVFTVAKTELRVELHPLLRAST